MFIIIIFNILPSENRWFITNVEYVSNNSDIRSVKSGPIIYPELTWEYTDDVEDGELTWKTDETFKMTLTYSNPVLFSGLALYGILLAGISVFGLMIVLVPAMGRK